MRTFGCALALVFSYAAVAQVWVKQITGAISDVQSIAVDAKKNCFVSGFSVGGTNEVTEFGTTNLPVGAFLAKYTSSGNLLYAQQTDDVFLLASVGDDVVAADEASVFELPESPGKAWRTSLQGSNVSIRAISACDNHSFVIAGNFTGALSIGRQTLVSTNDTEARFAARLDEHGRVIWLVEIPPGVILDIAGTKRGGAFVLNQFSPFVYALGPRGEFLWSGSISGSYQGVAYSVASDLTGRCYISGSFSGQMNVGDSRLVFNAGRSAYVARFTANGVPDFGWILNVFSNGEELSTDCSGNWYLGTTFFNAGAQYDGLVVKNGAVPSGLHFGGSDADWIQKMTRGRDNSVYVAGHCASMPASVGSVAFTNSGTFIGRFQIR